jgi:hypothetical protein
VASTAFDPGALLARTYPLPGGERVRLRLLRQSDAVAVRRLLGEAAEVPDELEVRRLLSFDPRHRVAVGAVALRGRGEVLLAAGAIDLVPGAQPDRIVVDPSCDDAVEDLLGDALRARARRAAA